MTTSKRKPKKTSTIVTSDKPAALELTAYQGGAAIVRERRDVTLPAGRQQLNLAGLPEQYVPGSLTVVRVVGEGKFTLGPTSFRPANLNQSTILLGAIGTTITLFEQTPAGPSPVKGTLRNIIGNQAILETDSGSVLVLPLGQKFELADGLPAGLTSVASLLMEPTVAKEGQFGIHILYESEGLTWQPRYEAFYDAKRKLLTRLACYVDLTNNSGGKLASATYKLIAGVNPGGHRPVAKRAMARAQAAPMAASFEGVAGGAADFAMESAAVESVGEQKMYTLPGELAVDNGETKTATLVFAENVPVTPEYYLGAGGHYATVDKDEDLPKLPVHVRLRAKNDKESNLGTALPPADVRVLEPDSQGALQKTDSSYVRQHVSTNEPFSLDLRNPSKDLKATRRLVDFKEDPEPTEEAPAGDDTFVDEGPHPLPVRPLGGPGIGTPGHESRRRADLATHAVERVEEEEKPEPPRFREEERQTTVHNYKDEDVVVLVSEYFPQNCEFLKKSQEFASTAPGNGTFAVSVPAGGSAEVSYRIKFRIN